jgi:thioredoxin reductase (NADPH)
MSRYLTCRIEQTNNIELRCRTEIAAMHGGQSLETVELTSNETGKSETVEARAVFIFIGAVPHTAWLPNSIQKDRNGFIKTGMQIADAKDWPLKRQPFLLETSCPGIFAVGDVRLGSVKRVASAVGEGSMAIQMIHEYLAAS